MNILVSHLESLTFLSFDMLKKEIDYCPDRLWYEKHGDFFFWQHILHALNGLLYWTATSQVKYEEPYPERKLYPELDHEPESYLSKTEMKEIAGRAETQLHTFFASREDSWLTEKSLYDDEKIIMEIIGMQLRHIQYHVGHCNCILREAKSIPVEWFD